ncbi:MAG TPA: hypothetical protein VFY11_12620 [Nocardioidaceae bacterium]|nr:hypothetical protein [Nocardioidaceae bacterium]
MMATVHAALVSAYATEADARAAFDTDPGTYHGIRSHPTPEAPLVHVWSDATDDQLTAAGWVRPETQEA